MLAPGLELNKEVHAMEFGWSRISRYFHPVLAEQDVREKPVQVEVGGLKIVLFRNKEQQIVAMPDRCPHRFTPLSMGRVDENGNIECPYHGWSFDAQGQGHMPHMPTSRSCRIEVLKTMIRNGVVWVGGVDAEPLEEFADPEYTFLGQFPVVFDCPLHVALDNFSEDEHFPYVHQTFGWDREGAKDVQYEFSQDEHSTLNYYRGPIRKFPLMFLTGVKPGDISHNRFHTLFNPVRSTYESWVTCQTRQVSIGGHIKTTIFFVPNADNRTTLYSFVHSRASDRKSAFFQKHFRPFILRFIKKEFEADGSFSSQLSHLPYALNGARLGKYDKPLVVHRRMLERIYLGEQ
ncbi:aromatic ring-hydroxylating dioxygenase subunit alpha [Pantoea sp. Tr-811]|uniref:aromatic ring-hydroxylating oxygenase subunit alpha n=1 Tax=Pantoea sp. Tr-811 TaxID=2608361 RepID=UPI00142235DB|nr:aromatic ring-hydroxylating dioxygenase subunit alpha [Pantoea sp. Tr-811]NIF27263.1 aromatic ring-hydroxylating dioxygenase subunit alpha [Pantoea sp. Tr-811]